MMIAIGPRDSRDVAYGVGASCGLPVCLAIFGLFVAGAVVWARVRNVQAIRLGQGMFIAGAITVTAGVTVGGYLQGRVTGEAVKMAAVTGLAMASIAVITVGSVLWSRGTSVDTILKGQMIMVAGVLAYFASLIALSGNTARERAIGAIAMLGMGLTVAGAILWARSGINSTQLAGKVMFAVGTPLAVAGVVAANR